MPPAPLQPLCPNAPVYVPGWPRPAYRYVRGLHPHPARDAAGHSYGKPEADAPPLHEQSWHENTPYLFGFDLYHEGYLWEAHEAWEGVWLASGRTAPAGRLVQALIFNAAAQLKSHMDQPQGAARHARRSLLRVAEAQQAYGAQAFGLDLAALHAALEQHYAPLWEGRPAPAGPPPCFHLGLPPRRD